MADTLITDEQLWELVESIWSTMLSLEVTRDHGGHVVHDFSRLTARVDLSGAFHGTVLFLPTEKFARQATAVMLAAPECSLTPADVDDAMGEMCNILSGGIKSLAPGPTMISLPSVVRDAQGTACASSAPVIAGIRFTCEGQPLEVQVLEKRVP
jgi:chemotaxis protein CheX